MPATATQAEATIIRPQPGPQTAFLSTPADIAIFGGAAGGGKTHALLMEPLRHCHRAAFTAVLFRRIYPEITRVGGMWDESLNLYPLLGAQPNKSDLEWHFPAGAKVAFGHIQYDTDRLGYQGAQICLLGFDQLEEFSESTFWFMLSRNRSVCGVRPYVRATVNPDADSWVARLIEWWIDPDTGYPLPERAGRVRWFVRDGERLVWADSPAQLAGPTPPKSLTFIPARLEDNPILMAKDPGYLANLLALPPVDQARLHGGNWKIRPAAGKIFNRAWFDVLTDPLPPGGRLCRGWDLAATARELADTSTAATAGTLLYQVGPLYVILDVIERQIGPAATDDLIVATAQADRERATQLRAQLLIRWEMEGGSAGQRDAAHLTRLLAGFDAQGVSPAGQGDKYVRSKPLAVQAQAHNVKVVPGPWVDGFLSHMHHQPDIARKDIHDSAAIAFNGLTLGGWVRGAAR